MHDTRVVLKTGEVLEAPIWVWRPREGWFSLVGSDPIRLSAVVSAVTPGSRVGPGKVVDQDELERAREDGWDGT